MLSIFNSESYMFYKKMLDIGTEKHRVIANNIANVNTPGFKCKDLDFQSELSRVLESGSMDELSGVIIKPDNTPVRRDGNNVDLNKEMSNMAKNSIMFKMYSQLMNRRFRSMKEVMKLS